MWVSGMNHKQKKIEALMKKTNTSYEECEQAFQKCNGDSKKAEQFILEKKESIGYKIKQLISALVNEEKSLRIQVTKDREEQFSVSLIIVCLFILLFRIPSFILVITILIILLFGCSIQIHITEKEEIVVPVIPVTEEKINPKSTQEVFDTQTIVGTDESYKMKINQSQEGFNEIIIEK